jgi:hypothetical protein
MLKKAGAAPPPEVDAETLKSYEGTYKGTNAEFTFVVKEGKLVGGVTGQNTFTLGALDKATFTALEFDGVTIIFNVEDGKVTSFTLKQGSNSTNYQRVERGETKKE